MAAKSTLSSLKTLLQYQVKSGSGHAMSLRRINSGRSLGNRLYHCGTGSYQRHSYSSSNLSSKPFLHKNSPSTVFRQSVRSNSTLNHIKDYYDILNVPKDSSQKNIKDAYYQLAKMYHPDVCATEHTDNIFQEISEAYETLGDESKRKMYDLRTQPIVHSVKSAMHNPFWVSTKETEKQTLIFKVIRSMKRLLLNISYTTYKTLSSAASKIIGVNNTVKTQMLMLMMDLTEEEALRGINKDILVNIEDTCSQCQGQGLKQNQQIETSFHWIHYFLSKVTSRSCRCSNCCGKGKVMQKRRVTVPVPPDTANGYLINLSLGNAEIFVVCGVKDTA